MADREVDWKLAELPDSTGYDEQHKVRWWPVISGVGRGWYWGTMQFTIFINDSDDGTSVFQFKRDTGISPAKGHEDD